MSKSNDDSLDSFINLQKALDYFVKCLEDSTHRIDTISRTLEDSMMNAIKREVAVKDANKLTKEEINNIYRTILKALKDMGIELTKEGMSIMEGARKSALATSQRVDVSLQDLTNKFINSPTAQLFKISEAGALKGNNSVAIKNFTDNKVAMTILKEINAKLNVRDELDSFGYKLKDFFGLQSKDFKKTLFAFGADLIEGLAKNKFIGGAISDTIRLVSFLGASLLHKYFGDLGDKIGAGLVAIGQVLSGLLPTLLIAGIGNLLFGGKLFKLLGDTFKVGFSFFKNLLGKGNLKNLFSGNLFKKAPKQMTLDLEGTLRGESSLARVGKFAKAGAKRVPIAGAALGALFDIPDLIKAGNESKTSLAKQGLKTAGGAVGTAVGGFIGGAIGAAAGGVAAPAGVILGGIIGNKIGHVIGGLLGKLINPLKEHKETLKSILDIMLIFQPMFNGIKNIVEGIWNLIPGKKDKNKDGNNGGGGSSGGGSLGQPMSGKDSKANIAGATTFGSLKVAKDGAILNISDLSQAEASKQLQAYEKADPTSFGRVYEWAGSNVARLGSFKTDAAKLNEKGQVTGALMYKGATDDMLALRNSIEAEFIRKGYDPTRAKALANSLAYTSGKMTGSNTQHKGKGKWKSHDNVYGFGFDIGGGQAWSEKEYNAVSGVVRDFYRAKGLQVAYEGAGQGASTGKHWDIKPIKNMRAKGAQEILDEAEAQQKAVAEQHSMDAAYILMKEDEQLARKILKEHSSETPEEIGKRYEEALNKKGIYNRPLETDKGTQGVWIRETDEGSKVIDYSENSSFTEDYLRNVTRNGAGQ